MTMQSKIDDEFSNLIGLPVLAQYNISELTDNWNECLKKIIKVTGQQSDCTVYIRGDLSYQVQSAIIGSMQSRDISFVVYGYHFKRNSEDETGVVIIN
ncbi:hypothetical protein GA516_01760 [Lactobacillus pentosus]|uniref:Uncharacterized protein n=1 Tax=Lactiplantibacillus pentosus TaxID=1589 RepID=A0ABD7IVM8_LACPE|nr:hypothetical protein [Lactiplantibacillus pentosus]BBM21824.1 uncharacterized protein SN13T_1860 [Lactiplantibacillus plantarum]AYG38770.1 hypothetical protein CFK27_12915 [Lactiplantibacillus pentosus]AYG41430.1 hypothetical protein CFI14_10070 [Lactiplantibacillus pentosus]MBO9166111.1 hypothetical protein [Lactiplantibacillus pentosus]MCB5220187.1 hypothetical protein [Lactiplantibacillus pentosus]